MYWKTLILSIMLPLLALGRNEWYDTPISISPGHTSLDTIGQNAISGEAIIRFRPAVYGKTCVKFGWENKTEGKNSFVSLGLEKNKHSDIIYSNNGSFTLSSSGEKGEFTYDEYITVKIVYDGYSCRLYVGGDTQKEAIDFPWDNGCDKEILIDADNDIECQRLTSEFICAGEKQSSKFASIGQLDEALAFSTDPIEGVWTYLDRDINASNGTLGGKYAIAIIHNDTGGYDIIYIGGSDINAPQWKPLMLKGSLSPTPFDGNYNLTWIDANFHILDDDNNAQLSDDDSILTLRFPIYKSQLRFYRAKDI